MRLEVEGLPSCPAAPHWRVDWAACTEAYPWIEAMKGVPQDPVFHAEGDVWTHVGMVCEAMAGLPAWRALASEDRAVLFAAALLHDVAKPVCTVVEKGRVSSRGHSRKGAIMAREILWRMGAPLALRERVCALVRNHMVPFWLIERDRPDSLAIEVSQIARCDHMAILAQADARGRICPDLGRLLENIDLFVATCEDEGCLRTPRAFPTDHTRVVYFRSEGRSPDVEAFDDTRNEVTLMSGLPGAGKDHWVNEHRDGQAVVALDAIRAELGISPKGSQGKVIALARERARVMLREGRPFIWNATNLTKRLRAQPLGLFFDYKARVRIVHIDAPAEKLYRQNRDREAIVPPRVIDKMVAQWEIPDRTEAHEVIWVQH